MHELKYYFNSIIVLKKWEERTETVVKFLLIFVFSTEVIRWFFHFEERFFSFILLFFIVCLIFFCYRFCNKTKTTFKFKNISWREVTQIGFYKLIAIELITIFNKNLITGFIGIESIKFLKKLLCNIRFILE